MCCVLSQEDDDTTPLGIALIERHSACAAALIDAGAPLRASGGSPRPPRREFSFDDDGGDPFDGSAIHEAVRCGRPLVVEALLEAGHDPAEMDSARCALPALLQRPPSSLWLSGVTVCCLR